MSASRHSSGSCGRLEPIGPGNNAVDGEASEALTENAKPPWVDYMACDQRVDRWRHSIDQMRHKPAATRHGEALAIWAKRKSPDTGAYRTEKRRQSRTCTLGRIDI